MKTKMTQNIVLDYVLSMVVIAIGISFFMVVTVYQKQARAMLGLPDKLLQVENKDSALLKLLITQGDFSDSYRWYGVSTLQSSLGNSNETENASASFHGYLNGRTIWITEVVIKYKSEITWDVSQAQLPEFSPNSQKTITPVGQIETVLDVDFTKSKIPQKSICAIFSDNSTRCAIALWRSDIYVELLLTYDIVSSENDVKAILDPLLVSIRGKISH